MPKAVLFHRFVIDTVAAPDGMLAPATGARWRWEPARDEADLPERLASVATATNGAIARAASHFGPLRLGAQHVGFRESFVRSNIARDSVAMLSELRTATEWYAAGMHAEEPQYARAYVAAGYALGTLAPDTLAAISRLLDDGAADTDIDLGSSLVDLAARFVAAYVARPGPAAEAVLRGLDVLDRLVYGLAGIEPIAALERAGGSGRVTLELVTALPEFLTLMPESARVGDAVPVASLRTAIETADEWRSAAAHLKDVSEAIRLITVLNRRSLNADEAQRLRQSATVVTGWTPESELRAAEVADRLRPLLRTTLEHQLDAAGVWPVREGVTTGSYWRALAALWERLTGERLPRLCATEGCDRPIGSRPNRLFCDIHRAERKRKQVRRARAASALVGSKR